MLRDAYSTHSRPQLAELTGRTISSIANRANKLGLCRNGWTGEEIAYLRRNAQKLSSVAMAKEINHTAIAIRMQASKLGLSLLKTGNDSPSTVYSDDDVILIRALRDGGMKYAEIAEKFETSIGAVWRLANTRKIAGEQP